MLDLADGAAGIAVPRPWLIEEQQRDRALLTTDGGRLRLEVRHHLRMARHAIDGVDDVAQFLERNDLVPTDWIQPGPDGLFTARCPSGQHHWRWLVHILARQLGPAVVRVVRLEFGPAPADGFSTEQLALLDEVVAATVITRDPPKLSEPAEVIDRRLIRPYRDVVLAMPWNWAAEWDDESKVALLYENGEGTGTLKVRLAWGAMLPPHAQSQLVRQITGPREAESTEGDGQREVSWQVIGVVGRSTFALFFDFVVSEAQLARPQVQREIRLLDESIRAVKIRPPS